MGVRALKTFLKNQCKDAIVEVDLKDMVRMHRLRFGDTAAPLLVVDGANCFVVLYEYNDSRGAPLDKVCGGQWSEFIENLRSFVKAFEELGVRLVFFFDGTLKKSKIPTWLSRQALRAVECRNVFDSLEAGNGTFMPNTNIPTHTLSYAFRFILKHALGQQVFTNLDRDCDQTIASYAQLHNAMAILSDDTDYLIFNHQVALLSVAKLNLEQMSSVIYVQESLCRQLQLPPSMLPLVACLVGNDLIATESLKGFRHWLHHNVKRDSTWMIEKVANFLHGIVGQSGSVGRPVTLAEVNKVYLRVFGARHATVSQRDFQMAFESYRIGDDICSQFPAPGVTIPLIILNTDSDLIDQVKLMTVTDQLPTLVYDVLAAGYVGIGVHLQPNPNQPSRTPWPFTAVAYQAIRKRLYGLIFQLRAHHSPDRFQPNGTVTEFYLNLATLQPVEDNVRSTPLCYEGTLVDISALQFNNGKNSHLKWSVLKACTMTTISVGRLQSLPPQYVTLCIILNYLLKKEVLSIDHIWEIQAILLQAILVWTKPAWIRKIQILRYDSRCLNLASLLTSGIIELINAISICGSPFELEKAMPWNYFDGKTFHYCYLSLSELSDHHRSSFIDECLTDMETINIFITLLESTIENDGDSL